MEPNGAILSDCELYRYALWRTVSEETGSIVGYFGVNPSTADHTIDDQTVKKWKGFCPKIPNHKVSKFLVGNLFAYRATDVNELKKQPDPIGIENDKWVDLIISRSDILIPCWGNSTKVPKELRCRIGFTEEKLKASGKPVLCFGKTKSGCPIHPQMLGYDTPIVEYF